MNELYGLDERANSEIKNSWLQLCINAGECLLQSSACGLLLARRTINCHKLMSMAPPSIRLQATMPCWAPQPSFSAARAG